MLEDSWTLVKLCIPNLNTNERFVDLHTPTLANKWKWILQIRWNKIAINFTSWVIREILFGYSISKSKDNLFLKSKF